MDIGAALRDLRTEKRLTLQQLATRTGLSASLISQVERNQADPSVVTLVKLAQALEVPVGHFFAAPPRPNCVVRKSQRKKLTFPESNLVYELLSPDGARRLELLMIHLAPEQHDTEGTVTHPGEECGVVLAGRMEIQVGKETYVLEEGDSIHFSSELPHRLRNPGSEPVVAVWVDCPPMF